jgi:hypothetical protein
MPSNQSKHALRGAALGLLILAGGAAHASSVTVNFDLLPDGTPFLAPNQFALTTALREQFAGSGAHFIGGGGVLTGYFGVAGTGGLNFMAFNARAAARYVDGSSAAPPEQIRFDRPANLVRLLVGSSEGGTATLTAFDAAGNALGSAQLGLTARVVPLQVTSTDYRIASVGLGVTGSRSAVVDDLVYVVQDAVNVPPTTQCALAGPAGTNGWYLGDVTATLTAHDSDGTVVANQYRVDGGTWQPYSTPVVITGNGKHTLEYQSIDNSGAWEDVQSASVNIDTTPPTTQCALAGPAGDNGWYLGNVTATLTAQDPDDTVVATQYRVDGGTWQPFSAPVVITGEGKHTLEYQSVDNAGVWEDVQAASVKIDTTPPTTQCALAGPAGDNGWYLGDVTATLTAQDAYGTVVAIQYRVDGGTWQAYSAPVVITGEGKHTLEYHSVDNAGAWEDVQSDSLKIDTTPPVVDLRLSRPYLWPPNGKMVPVVVNGSASDAVSGGVVVRFQVVDEYGKLHPSLTGFGQTIQLQAWVNPKDWNGRYYWVTATATDGAGRTSTVKRWVVVPHHACAGWKEPAKPAGSVSAAHR